MGVNGDAMVVRDASEGYHRQATSPVGYKQTEVGVIPEDWDVSTLSVIATVSSGATPARSSFDRYYRGGSIPWVKTLDLTNKEIAKTDELVTRAALKDTALRMYPKGTVLVAMYGGDNQIGRTGYLAFPATTNQALSAIVSQEEKIYPKYLLYVLNYRVDYWKSVASSSRKDPNITGNDVRNFLIPLPSVYEQRAIAAALSDVDALLEGLDRLIAKKRDLKQAAMQQLLTGQTRLPGFEGEWEVKRLGDHVTFLRNGTNSRAELTTEGKVKYLHYGDIHASAASFLEPIKLPALPEDKAKRLDRLRDGDLVFADASEDMDGVGKSVEIAGTNSIEVVPGLHTIAARFDKAVLADGFKAYLQFIPEFSQAIRRLAAGTKVYATTRSHIAGVEMQIPDVDEQMAIAAVFQDMDVELEVLEQRRAKTADLKKAMMQELLTGRTRLL